MYNTYKTDNAVYGDYKNLSLLLNLTHRFTNADTSAKSTEEQAPWFPVRAIVAGWLSSCLAKH